MSIDQEVIKFIVEFTRTDIEKIKIDTLINDDLGIDGDDGPELLEAFSKRFDVDISMLNKIYFGPEGFPWLSLIIYPIMFVFGGRKKEVFSPLPVKVLVDSAKVKTWTDI
jgi:acyl carrier protein